MINANRMLLTIAAVGLMVSSAGADLIITEVCDGTLSGGPKWVELTNSGTTTLDLTLYSIGNMNNGSTTLGGGASTTLTGTLDACDSYIVGYETPPTPPSISVFEDVYGFAPDIFIGPFINGDDVIIVFLGTAALPDGSDATIHDVCGVIGVDGTGEPWEWLDSYGFRNSGACDATDTFDINDWTFAGPDALEDAGGDDDIERQNLINNTNPGSAGCCTIAVEGTTWGKLKSQYRE